jgi:hypothetical protein
MQSKMAESQTAMAIPMAALPLSLSLSMTLLANGRKQSAKRAKAICTSRNVEFDAVYLPQ